MPGVVDRPIATEEPGMIGDHLVAHPYDDPVGISSDLDCTTRRPSEEGEAARMCVEQHLPRLARIRSDVDCPRCAKPHVDDLR